MRTKKETSLDGLGLRNIRKYFAITAYVEAAARIPSSSPYQHVHAQGSVGSITIRRTTQDV